MPRKPNTTSRRAEIVAAMQSVMAKQGYEKATVQAIAKEAGLAPGLIHYHFKSKQEILLELVKTLADYAQARFKQVAANTESPMAQLESYLHARLGLGEGAAPDYVAAWVMIGAEAVRQPEVRAAYQQVLASELAALIALLKACYAEQEREDTDAEQTAAALIALMEGAYQLSCSVGSIMPVGYAYNAALSFAKQRIMLAATL